MAFATYSPTKLDPPPHMVVYFNPEPKSAQEQARGNACKMVGAFALKTIANMGFAEGTKLLAPLPMGASLVCLAVATGMSVEYASEDERLCNRRVGTGVALTVITTTCATVATVYVSIPLGVAIATMGALTSVITLAPLSRWKFTLLFSACSKKGET